MNTLFGWVLVLCLTSARPWLFRKCFIFSHQRGSLENSYELFFFSRICVDFVIQLRDCVFSNSLIRAGFTSETIWKIVDQSQSSKFFFSFFLSLSCMYFVWLPFIKRLQYRVICGSNTQEPTTTKKKWSERRTEDEEGRHHVYIRSNVLWDSCFGVLFVAVFIPLLEWHGMA